MTTDEARSVLGVSTGASEADVRRAYTRLVKQHKPDRDPEGFRRVREAYELLRDTETVGTLLAAMAPPPSNTEPSASEGPLPDDPDRALALPRAELFARIRALKFFETARVPDLLRAHLAEHPDDDMVRTETVRVLASTGDFVGAIALMEEGTRRGREPLGFVAQLALWKPSLVVDDALAKLGADLRFAPFAAVVLLARGDVAGAARRAREALADDVASGRRRRALWLQIVAAMFERGGTATARELYATLDREMPSDVTDREPQLHGLLVGELVDVAEHVEPALVRLLGMYLCSPVRGIAVLDADTLLVDREAASVAVMRTRAPNLLGLVLPGATSPSERVPLRTLVRMALLVAVPAVLGLAFLVYDWVAHPERHSLVRSPQTIAICASYAAREACDASRAIDYHLLRGDCPRARRAASTLMTSTRYTGDAASEAEAQRARVVARCAERP